MMPLQPTHFALSEAVLASVTALVVWRLAARERIAALALVPFGLAALIGTVRIAAQIQGPIVELHQFVSRSGGAFGLAALVAVLAGFNDLRALISGLAIAMLAHAIPATAQPLFGALILAGAVLAARRGLPSPMRAGLGFAVLLIAQLASTALRPAHPALAWHVFHLLVALWVFAVGELFKPGRQAAKSV